MTTGLTMAEQQGMRVAEQLFERACADLDDTLARRRLNGGNCVLWVAAHMVMPRAAIARALGAAVQVPWGKGFERGDAPPAADAPWPRLDEVRSTWRDVSATLHSRIGELTPGQLAGPAGEGVPSTDGTLRGAIALLAFHDAYHVGQLGYLRRGLGLARLVG